MSSFLGHSLAALGIYAASNPFPRARWQRWGWGVWLTVLALAPDVDYVVQALNPAAHGGSRITHSVCAALLLPLVTVLLLRLAGLCGRRLRRASGGAAVAGLSHLLLDALVGVTPLPLLWPLNVQGVRLPIGMLPSAGAIRFDNPYFYHNLMIEMGALVPLLVLLHLYLRHPTRKLHRVWWVTLGAVSLAFMGWASRLAR